MRVRKNTDGAQSLFDVAARLRGKNFQNRPSRHRGSANPLGSARVICLAHRARMSRLRILPPVLCSLAFAGALQAQQQPEEWVLKALNGQGWFEYNLTNDIVVCTGGVFVSFSGALMTADKVTLHMDSGAALAEGSVRIEHEDQFWAGEHIQYNFKSHQMAAEEFRSGRPPIFSAGEGLHGNVTNHVYEARRAYVTSDDIADPIFKVRASYIKIIPGKRIEAHNAVLYVDGVPVFYYPFYSRNLGEHANNFNFIPGYRSIFGPYLLSDYTWYLNPELNGILHVDERQRRGPGAGPTFNYNLGEWGQGTLKYYYQYDHEPQLSATNGSIPNNRQRLYFTYLSSPATNLEFRAMARYQGDSNMVREFFVGEYIRDPQPDSYLEANKFWKNFSFDVYAQPRFDDFLETVERLPDARLTGYRQEIGDTPVYYESQSSAGYYRHLFIETNGLPNGTNFSAGRADTFHQLTLPETFFGWLDVTPNVGGRYTWYSAATGPGATTGEQNRGVFNAGVDVSFKASRLWPEVQSDFLEMDGLRHIVQPYLDYVYVPRPNVAPTQVPQFDTELPSLRLLPIDFPDYNDIDSIDSENVLRMGIHNKIQTKRRGEVVNLVDWNLYLDWRLDPLADQTRFSDVYSDFTFKPRSWLTFESITRFDISDGDWRLAVHTLTLQPTSAWKLSLSHFYLKDDLSGLPTALGIGNNLFTGAAEYRVNENWGLRGTIRYEARDGIVEEQDYSIFRDLRSGTAALTFRVFQNPIGPADWTVAFTFSLKASPHFGTGADPRHPFSLLGG